jgi:LysM repeat protein
MAQNGLVALMAVAFGAIIVARLAAGGPALTPAQAVAGATATPSVSATPTVRATTAPEATPAPDRTLVPTEVDPTATPAPTAVAEATPRASVAAKTYTVKKGDTLWGIAGEFGTTPQLLAEVNGLDDPRGLRVGQVLTLP